MHLFKLDSMKGGWFIGDFEPSVMQTKDFAVGWRQHAKGEPIEPYFHVLAPEVNVIVRGRVRVNDQELAVGDIFLVHPKEVCRIEFLEDTDLVVVKWPSVPGDEYPEDVRNYGRVTV
ncbi:MAG: hypothetical protein KDB80_00545 [Planctomycetes bacterium]|nr:hypothetical protein [Planctomycetota bacterium]